MPTRPVAGHRTFAGVLAGSMFQERIAEPVRAVAALAEPANALAA
jgi:hypothetical protein